MENNPTIIIQKKNIYSVSGFSFNIQGGNKAQKTWNNHKKQTFMDHYKVKGLKVNREIIDF